MTNGVRFAVERLDFVASGVGCAVGLNRRGEPQFVGRRRTVGGVVWCSIRGHTGTGAYAGYAQEEEEAPRW